VTKHIQAEALSSTAFSPYGDVIETQCSASDSMNDRRFDRFSDLASVDIVGPEKAMVHVVRSIDATSLPYEFVQLERHPLGSQAFVPLSEFVFVVVVAPPGDKVDATDIRAFVSNGGQGINYHRGTWHMPLIALSAGQRFLVIERASTEPNCDSFKLDAPVILDVLPDTA